MAMAMAMAGIRVELLGKASQASLPKNNINKLILLGRERRSCLVSASVDKLASTSCNVITSVLQVETVYRY